MNNPTHPSAPSHGKKDPSAQSTGRIGDILKLARESRGISIETLSKELKLNSRYLQALEANDYDQLPGDTYIRVYLRSVCVYLSLNPDEILKRFFDERGLTGVDTLRKDSSTKIDLMTVREKEKPGPTLYIVLALIAVVVAFAFFVNSRGWFSILPQDADVDDLEQQIAPVADTTAETPVLPPVVIPRASKKRADSPVFAAARKNNIKDTLSRTAAAQHSVKDTAHKTRPPAPVTAAKDTLSQKTAAVKKTQDSLAKVVLRRLAADSARLKAAIAQHPVKDSAQKAPPPAVKPAHKDTVNPAIKPVKDTGAQKTAPAKATKDSAKAVKQPVKDTTGVSPVAKPKSDSLKAVKDSAKVTPTPAKTKKDSAKTAAPASDSAKKTVKTSPVDTTKPVPATPSPKTAMKLRITAQKDSSYAVTYRDGIRSRNMFHSGRSMYFIARDSFNVTIGANENTMVTLDGKPLSIPGTGKVSFKVDASGNVTAWTEDEWNSVFSGR
jgi:cytoskeletal protein RodZ